MRNNAPFYFDEMNGHNFEHFCAEVLRKNGFGNINITRGSRDYGVDILAEKDGVSYAIQCKRYNGKVGNKAVQEVFSGKSYYSCDKAIVLTNSYFTEQAIDTAKKTGVVLWNRDDLCDMYFAYQDYKSMHSRQGSRSSDDKNTDYRFTTAIKGGVVLAIAWIVIIIILVFKYACQ